MTIQYHDVLQGSDEWAELRTGILTASEVKLVITPTLKVADNEKTRTHLWELLAQRVTRYVEPTFYSDDMLRGHADEEEARKIYSKHFDKVEEIGFITNDDFGFTLGYSPDGLIRKRTAGIECKSRRQKYQVQTIVEHHLTGAVPADYLMQCHAGMLIANLTFIDLVSYSGGLPMTSMRIHPDDAIRNAIIEAAGEFERKLVERLEAYHDAVVKPGMIPTERRIEQEMYI